MQNIMNFISRIFLLTCAVFMLAESASAKQLEVCNQADRKIRFGYAASRTGHGWQSRGRWSVEATNCLTIELGNVTDKIYIWAYSDSAETGMHWGGTKGFCAKNEGFEIDNADQDSEGGCASGQFRVFGTSISESSGSFKWTVGTNNITSSHYKLCNQSGQEIHVSYVMLKGASNWQAKGWRNIANGDCSEIRIHSGRDIKPGVDSDNGLRLFAYSEDRKLVWNNGSESFCMPWGPAFTYDNANTMACGGTDRGKVKYMMKKVKPGVTTYNFTTGEAVPAKTFINYCNETDTQVYVARAYNDGSWKSRGWTIIEPGQCEEKEQVHALKDGDNYVLGYKGLTYYAARSQGYALNWGKEGGKVFCVDTGVFNQADSDCTGETRRKWSFQSHNVQPGVQTVKFTATNGTPKTVLNLCNDNDFTLRSAYAATVLGYTGKSSHGFQELLPGSCVTRTLWKTDNIPANGSIHVYARNSFKQGWTWGNSNTEICVHTNKVFDYADADTRSCATGSVVRVKTLALTAVPGVNTVRFSASNANRKTEVEFCNRTTEDVKVYDVINYSRPGPEDDVAGLRAQYRVRIAPGSCIKKAIVDFNGSAYAGGTYAYFAFSATQGRWTGETRYCYGNDSNQSATQCADADKRGFRSLPQNLVVGTPVTINFDPLTADPTKYSFCNRTRQTLTAAVAYETGGKIVSVGLGTLAVGACANPDLKTPEGLPYFGKVYVYAKGFDGTVYSLPNKSLCIAVDPTKTITYEANAACSNDQRLVDMKEQTGLASRTNTFSIRESDAFAKSTLNVCNQLEKTARVAYAYYKDAAQGFTAQGWIEVAPDSCEDIKIAQEADAAYEGNVLVYAESSGFDPIGSGPLSFCVNQAGDDWTFPMADHMECNDANLKRVEAELIFIKALENKTYNLVDPDETANSTENAPRPG